MKNLLSIGKDFILSAKEYLDKYFETSLLVSDFLIKGEDISALFKKYSTRYELQHSSRLRLNLIVEKINQDNSLQENRYN